jgi:hypothetical protein
MAKKLCPVCGHGLLRVHRREEERALRGAEAVRRYRCVQASCGWEGALLREAPASAHHRHRQSPGTRARFRRALFFTVALLGAALLGVVCTGWIAS